MRYCSPSPNDGPPGELHAIAIQQLEVWESVAYGWPRYPDGRCVRCGKCDQSMYMLRDIQGVMYDYSDSEIDALIVAHLRQRHEEVLNGND